MGDTFTAHFRVSHVKEQAIEDRRLEDDRCWWC